MGSTPTIGNTAAKTVDRIISGVIYDAVVPLAEAAATAQFPFLGWPVIKTLFDFGVKYLAGVFVEQLGDAGVKLVITIQTDAEKSAYAQAEAELRAAHLSQDPAQVQKATEDFKNAFRSLVHYDGDSAH